MSIHSHDDFGRPGRFVAVLDPDDPFRPAFQGLARDETGALHAVMARQNHGTLEFVVYAQNKLAAERKKNPSSLSMIKAELHMLNCASISGGKSFVPFRIDAEKDALFWRHTERAGEIEIASKYAETLMDYIATDKHPCRVVNADRSKRGMISRMHLKLDL